MKVKKQRIITTVLGSLAPLVFASGMNTLSAAPIVSSTSRPLPIVQERWSCPDPIGGTCFLIADLGRVDSVTGIQVAWYQGNSRRYAFSVAVSIDAAKVRTAYTGKSSGTTTGLETYMFPAALSARYVELSVSQNSIRPFAASVTDLVVLGCQCVLDAGAPDVFGVTKLYASAGSRIAWDSRHWQNGHPRDILDRDPDDPTQVSQQRGDSARVHVDGNGILQFLGTGPNLPQPRLYLNDPADYFFNNVEITLYYQRVADDNTPWGGAVLGARSGPDGHSVDNTLWCDAHTYYGRIRHDGTKDFDKELKHPGSLARGATNIWNGGSLPFNIWIGMKYIIYNIDNNSHVKMELYRDLTEGKDGGTWEKVGEIVDAGNWVPPQASPVCSYPPDFIPVTGGGVIILRDTGTTETRYKWFSAREIAPPLP